MKRALIIGITGQDGSYLAEFQIGSYLGEDDIIRCEDYTLVIRREIK